MEQMEKITLFDCVLYYVMDCLEVVIDNGHVEGFVYRNPEDDE